jgi:hypothetical protein
MPRTFATFDARFKPNVCANMIAMRRINMDLITPIFDAVLMLSIVESMCHTRYRVFLTILGEPLRRGIPHPKPITGTEHIQNDRIRDSVGDRALHKVAATDFGCDERFMRLLKLDASLIVHPTSQQSSQLSIFIGAKDECQAVVGMNATVKKDRMIRMRPR